MTKQNLISAAGHGLIAIALQLLQWLVFGWPSWVCAMFPLGLFYGREQSQEGRKAADRLMVNHDQLWKYPREALGSLWPGSWGGGNRLDFLIAAAALGFMPVLSFFI